MVRHSVQSIEFTAVIDDVAMHIGIQFSLMLFINGLNAAIGAEYDMIDKIGVAHNATKVHNTTELCKSV